MTYLIVSTGVDADSACGIISAIYLDKQSSVPTTHRHTSDYMARNPAVACEHEVDDRNHTISRPPRWRTSTMILCGSIGAVLAGAFLLFLWAVALRIVGYSDTEVESHLVPLTTCWVWFVVIFVHVDGFIIADRVAVAIASLLPGGKRLTVCLVVVLMSGLVYVPFLKSLSRLGELQIISDEAIFFWFAWFGCRYLGLAMPRRDS